jgi:hypothetical protein
VLKYHFYRLDAEGRILGVVDIELNDDESAFRQARSLLGSCQAVEVLRGALVLGEVKRDPSDPPFRTTFRRKWLDMLRPRKWWSMFRLSRTQRD